MQDPTEKAENVGRHRASKRLGKIMPRKCCHCEVERRIHCHHIDEDPLNDKLLNLCWLCPLHHRQIHSMERRGARLKREIQASVEKFTVLLKETLVSLGSG